MSEDVRPFEEYKEMIKDMRKEEMIKGLYDLSARITKQDKEIERLNNRLKTSNDTCNYLRNTIDKAIKYIEEHIYKYYDTQFEEYVEETEFESNTQPNVLLDILKGEKNV